MRWKRSWPDLSERLPVDYLPISNGEHIPPPPTAAQLAMMKIAEDKSEEVRRKLGMSRRDFVRSSAAIAVGLWAMQAYSAEANHRKPAACDLHNPAAQMENWPGEFIFDIQTHHVEEDGLWRLSNPGFQAAFIALWPQARNCGELDPVDCLGRLHYLKEVYLDSSTTMGVLSAVPSSPDRNPLPTKEAIETVQVLNGLAQSQRAVMHSFVMPNRGSYGGSLSPGIFWEEEKAEMARLVSEHGDILRAWKCYTPWGDIPNASGWFHDDVFGRAMIEHAIEIGRPVIATHKGFALPSFDQRSAACRDIGIVAKDYFNDDDAKCLKVIVYHSGFDSETQRKYAGDLVADSSARGTDSLVKSLRENGWSARHFAPGGTPRLAGTDGDGDPAVHANVPNVYAEIGSTWRTVMSRTGSSGAGVEAAHCLGKLIYYVGPRRVVWGTDSLWYGSPQPEIARLREFPNVHEIEARRILAEEYHLPHALDGDVDLPHIDTRSGSGYNPASSMFPSNPPAGWPSDAQPHPERSIRNGIFGRNAAVPYGVDPDADRFNIDCNEVERMRRESILDPGLPTERRQFASMEVFGPRTRRELFAGIWPNKPWAP